MNLMESSAKSESSGKKIFLAVMLAGVLIYVLKDQLLSTFFSPETRQALELIAQVDNTPGDENLLTEEHRSLFKLENILQNNPFQSIRSAESIDSPLVSDPSNRRSSMIEQELEGPQRITMGVIPPEQISAILTSSKGRSALIEGNIYHEGDVLPDGKIVKSITASQVLVNSTTPGM